MSASEHAERAPTHAAIEVRGLYKAFRIQRSVRAMLRAPRSSDSRDALRGVDLEVPTGETFGLLGRNGAGKSTLFKILATLISPDAGTVSVAGHDIREAPARVRDALVPVIPNERSLYWRLSADENLRLYAALYGLRGAAATRRVDQVLSVVGLETAGTKQVGLFSSGMKQRLLIARALLGRPAILLLDEPTRSLDPISAREFRRFVREELTLGQGTTILLATHDYEEVTELCGRVAILEDGRILASGATHRVLAMSERRRVTLWTDQPTHPVIAETMARVGGSLLGTSPAPDSDGWWCVQAELSDDEAAHAEVLGALQGAGLRVSRFIPERLALADLLEHVRTAVGKG